MNIEIKKYDVSENYEKVLKLLESEGEEWKSYQNPAYQTNLEQSHTYVAYVGEVLCGYSRSMNDYGLFTWVIDLLVHKNYRGNSIGKKLLERVQLDFPNQDIFIMSDADGYYQKLGYKKEGTIFKMQ